MPQYTFASQFTTTFEYSQAKLANGHKLCILFLHGLCSDPWGRKGDSLKAYAQEKGFGFCRFEMVGHGSDAKHYEQTTLDIWKEQTLEVMQNIIKEEKIVLVGSSIGGWLALSAACVHPERVRGIIGLAAAPDFSQDLYDGYLSEAQKQELRQKGKIHLGTADFTYTFIRDFFETAQKHLLLHKEIPLECPVHLLQGTADACLLPDKALKIAQALKSNRVVVKMIKNSNHRLQSPEDIRELFHSLDDLCL